MRCCYHNGLNPKLKTKTLCKPYFNSTHTGKFLQGKLFSKRNLLIKFPFLTRTLLYRRVGGDYSREPPLVKKKKIENNPQKTENTSTVLICLELCVFKSIETCRTSTRYGHNNGMSKENFDFDDQNKQIFLLLYNFLSEIGNMFFVYIELYKHS